MSEDQPDRMEFGRELSFAIKPGQVAIFAARYQFVALAITRISADEPEHFHVNDFKVGNHSQFSYEEWKEGVPATQLAQLRPRDVVRGGQDVSIEVKNTSSVARIFGMTISGRTAPR